MISLFKYRFFIFLHRTNARLLVIEAKETKSFRKLVVLLVDIKKRN